MKRVRIWLRFEAPWGLIRESGAAVSIFHSSRTVRNSPLRASAHEHSRPAPRRSWTWLGLLALAAGLGAVPAAEGFEFYVNAGGPEHVLPDGRVFVADGPYSSGQGYGWNLDGDYFSWHAIGGCLDDLIYKHFHSSPGRYRIDVPNGNYAVTLHLCEGWGHSTDLHKMDWTIEGLLVLDDLDVYAQVERDYALDYRFAVTVSDGQILLDDTPLPHTQFSAISVVSHDPDLTAPAPPLLTEVLNGFGEIILNWEDNQEPDLAGYPVYRRLLPHGSFERLNSHPHATNLVSRYIDRDVVPGNEYEYRISAIDLYSNESAPAGPFTGLARSFVESPLPVCRIEIDPDSLWVLNQNVYADDYYGCTVTLDGILYEAGLRYRGNMVRPLSKKSYKIKLAGDFLFEGRSRLNLNADMCDACGMRSALSMWLFERCRVPAPRTWLRALTLNDEYMGYYCDVEQIDERFLAAHDLDEDATIYKCLDRLVALEDSLDYYEKYEKKTNEDEPWDDLIDFIETLNTVSDEDFYGTFIAFFDFDEWLRYYAVLNTLNDGDSYSKNYYLYHSHDDNLWKVIPWDKDLTWGARTPFNPGVFWMHPLVQNANAYGNMLAYRVLSQPMFKNLYATTLYEHVTELAPLGAVYAAINATHTEVEANGEVDVRKWYWEENERFRDCDAEIRAFAEGRYDFILERAHILVTPQELYINEFMAANETVIADEAGEYDDWIEIYNPGPDPIQMRDYFLTDDLTDPLAWQFPDTTLAAGGFLLVWADRDLSQGPLHADFKLNRDGELIALHRIKEGVVGDPGPTDIDPVDLIFFGEQATDISRGRIYNGDYRWAFIGDPTPGASNGSDQGIGDDPAGWIGVSAPVIQATPNPFHDRVSLRLPEGYRGQRLDLYDVTGRLCRSLPAPGGGGQWQWDGRLSDGQPAPPGLYWARARMAPAQPDSPVPAQPESERSGTVRLLLLR
jgi:hypothetical protein